jgi:gamma-glutamylcyclotransferase (GGCT)/AIG2-like uncharacterized protein YtfP
MTQFYFSYGHNTNASEMHRRIPRAEKVGTGYMKNTRLVLHRVAGVEPKAGCVCHGVVWKIPLEDWPKLDEFEGIGVDYKKVQKTVFLNHVPTKMVLYVQLKKHNFCPSKKYMQWLVKGYTENGLSLTALKRAINDVSKTKRPCTKMPRPSIRRKVSRRLG